MATQLESQFIQQFSDASGLLVGGSVYFYAAGSTTTLQAIYTSSAGTTELSNPQTLGSLGELQNVVYLSGNYNLVVKDSNGVTKFQRDNFDATAASRSVSDFMLEAQSAGTVIGGWSLVQAQSATVTLAAGDIVFGDTDGALYQLTGDGAQDPEADSYNVNTGVGTDWIKLAISNAPITQSNLDTINATIAALTATINNRGYLSGLALSNATDTEHDISAAAGTAQDSSGTYRMTTTSAFVKAIDAAWAEGTNQGGFPDNLTLTADTWYRYYMVGKTSSVTAVDFGFDTSTTAANLLNGTNAGAEGYTIYRQIGWVLTDASLNIVNFIQTGNYIQWDSPETDITGSGTSWMPTTRTNYGVKCPPSTLASMTFSFFVDSGSGASTYCLGMATSPDASDVTPTATLSNLPLKYALQDDGGGHGVASNLLLKANSSSEIGLKFFYNITHSTYATYLYGITNGYYYDPRDI